MLVFLMYLTLQMPCSDVIRWNGSAPAFSAIGEARLCGCGNGFCERLLYRFDDTAQICEIVVFLDGITIK